jgi:hypothetical protein
MSRLQSEFNSATDFLGVLSVGSVVLSSILLVTPVKAVGYIGIGSGLGAFTASVVARRKHLQVAEGYLNQATNDYAAQLLAKEEEIVTLSGTVSSLKSSLNQAETHVYQQGLEVFKLQNQAEQLAVQNQSHLQLVEQVTGELDRLIILARTAVEECLDEWRARLSSLVATKKDQYPKLTERLNALLDEGQGKLADYTEKLAQTPSKWDSLADLLSLYYCLNDDLVNVKVRAIQAIAKLTNQATQLELQEVSEILEDWQTANLVPRDKLEHIIKNYEAALNEFRLEFSSRFDATHQFAVALEGQAQEDDKFVQNLIAKIRELEAKIHQLSKPITYPGATRADMRIANIVIGYFEKLGLILDRAGSDYRNHEATLEFITDRTGRLVLASELNDHSEILQGFIHTLNKPEFKLDPETGLMTLLVRWASKPAVDNTDLAKRLLTPLDEVVKKLVGNLSHKPTIRVMGATGEGKGVMVRYLLKSILANHVWYCRLHDPQDGSSEDHWGIPKVSKSGGELKQALKDIEKQMIQREASGWSVVTLDVLDEIDTHLERKEKKESFIDLISRIRHLGMKLILIGQNPKVGRAGFEWSDMQQMNCIYMGASAFDAIEANPQLKPRKDKLTKDYLTLSEHYEKVNEGLGDGEKYLFGLVVIPGKTPMWIELPRPDSIEINCNDLLLGKYFNIPNSFIELIARNNSADATGDSGKTNRNSVPSASAVTFTGQTLADGADTPDYVGVAGTVGIGDKSGKATCKKHPEVELRPQSDGRYYCKSCKKRVAKSSIEYRQETEI